MPSYITDTKPVKVKFEFEVDLSFTVYKTEKGREEAPYYERPNEALLKINEVTLWNIQKQLDGQLVTHIENVLKEHNSKRQEWEGIKDALLNHNYGISQSSILKQRRAYISEEFLKGE